jgi:Fe-S-cluster containining protein
MYDIWLHPETGEDVSRCPWLRKLPWQKMYICRIQDIKPEICRDYPVSKEGAEETGCPGFG